MLQDRLRATGNSIKFGVREQYIIKTAWNDSWDSRFEGFNFRGGRWSPLRKKVGKDQNLNRVELFHSLIVGQKQSGFSLNSGGEVQSVAAELNVKPEEVLEMETRLSGQELAFEGERDDEEAFAPAHYLADPAAEPSQQLEAKENELQTVLIQAKDRWTAIANQNEEYAVTPLKKDVAVEVFGLGWVPQWYMVLDGAAVMWPAFPQGLQGE